MEKAQENSGAVSPAEKVADITAALPETKTTAAEQKLTRVEGVLSEHVKSQAPIASSHALDVPPAPEAVVAAVAAIVETNTLIPLSVESTEAGNSSNQEPSV